MKKSIFLLVILCALWLTGCQKTNSSITSISQEQDITEIEDVQFEDASNSEPDINELENTEYIESDKEDINDDKDSIDRINKYMIPEQSFDISLNDWGEVLFVSCLPMPNSEGVKDPYSDVSFYLISDDKVVYRFPYVNILENDTCVREDNIRQRGMIDLSYGGISFVMFTDVNGDANDDLVIGIFYCTGIGPQGAIPFIEVRIYEDKGSEFVYNENLCENLWELPYDITAREVKALLLEESTEEDVTEISVTWQDAYKNIIKNIQSNLADPYNFLSEFGFYGQAYVGIHDFDNNNIPELIIGSVTAVTVFTYEEGKAKKVADLYEPEEWGGINYLCYKDNHLVLMSCGNGENAGDGYVCFTYEQGEYITGFYFDYHPDEAVINGEPVSKEEFLLQFDVLKLKENDHIEFNWKNNAIAYCKVNDEDEILLAGNDEWIAMDDLDFCMPSTTESGYAPPV